MKRFPYLLCILCMGGLVIGCSKEVNNNQSESSEKIEGVPGIIQAEIMPLNATKVTLDIDDVNDVAHIEWVKDNQFLLIVQKVSDGSLNHNRFTAQSNGTSVPFSGSLPDGTTWSETGFAVSVPAGMGAGSNNDWGYGYVSGNISSGVKLQFRGTAYNRSSVDPLTTIPMVGVKTAGKYVFHAATAVFKFTVNNWPTSGAFVYLTVPSPGTLQGEYPLDEDGYVYMSTGGNTYRERFIQYSTSTPGTTVDFYFSIPIGELPVNTNFSILDSGYASLYQQTFTTAVEAKKNTLTEIAPLTYRAVADIVGTYSNTTVTAGSYSSNYATGDFKLEASDNGELGNVMLTKFAGQSGKIYGTFNPVNSLITFSKEQIFGDDPYGSGSDEYDKIALVSHNGSSAVDVVFKVTPSGKIKFTGTNLGFRRTNEITWTSSYGGAWPWSLCYGSFVAEQ